jgi:hypothetical protein
LDVRVSPVTGSFIFPTRWIVADIVSDFTKFVIIANDMVVEATLPFKW